MIVMVMVVVLRSRYSNNTIEEIARVAATAIVAATVIALVLVLVLEEVVVRQIVVIGNRNNKSHGK